MSLVHGALRSVTPARGEALPYAGGCLATGCLHGIASIVIMGLGTAFGGRDGSLIVLPFWVFLGVTQWLYLAPVALVLKRLRFSAASKGVWLGGAVMVLLTMLYWGGLGVMGLIYHQKAAVAQRFAREHPIVSRDVAGTIVAVDPGRIDVQTSEGIVSIELRSTTHYIRTNGPFGNVATTPDLVKLGAAVVVEASSFDGGPLYADYVKGEITETGESPGP
jgi:hypothetical protein